MIMVAAVCLLTLLRAVKGAPAWKFNALGVNEGKGKGDQKLLPKDEPFQPPEEQPKTSENFERVWKKSCRCSQDRYDFLLKFCTRETIKQIFKVNSNTNRSMHCLSLVHESLLTAK